MQNADTPGWALGTGKFHLSRETLKEKVDPLARRLHFKK
jgi:hypothetical protein